MQDQIQNFYLKQPEPNRSCFLALREIILQYDNNFQEVLKYGMPCFCYDKHIICYLWKDKKTEEPYLLMTKGNLIEHDALESGNRAKMKIYRVNPNSNIDIQSINELLKLSLKTINLS